MTPLEEDKMRRVQTYSRHLGLAISIAALLMVSALPFVANITMGLPGYWTDRFDDETKIAQKNNVVVSGGDASLGTSGSEWFRQGVVVDSGPPGSGFWKVLYPTVLRTSNGLFHMWFTAREAAPSIMERIHYATSTDGKNWNRYGVVIGENATQEDRVYAPTVIEDSGMFKMWYVADDLDPPYGARIFYATSPDGLTWTRQGMVMNVGFEGTYDTRGLNFPWVMKEASTYKMWYSGYEGANYRILYATSLDGQAWTSQGMVIDHGPAGSPDAINVMEITIDRDPSELYHAWYIGSNATGQSQLNATSLDGVTWTKKGVTMKGLPGTLEAVVGSGSLMISSNWAFSLWYIGHDGGGIFRIFLANYSKYGNIISESIGPFPNCDWGTFYANKTDPSADVFVKFTLLDGTDWSIIPGHENMSATMVSLASIDFNIHPTIRLKADFWDLLNSASNTPLLHDWTVTYIDLDDPIFDGLLSAVDDGTGGNINLNWNPASDVSTPITYNVYMATSSLGQNFATPDYSTPSVGMQVTGLTNGMTHFFIVRAQDAVGNEDSNTVERDAMPTTPVDSTPPDFLGLVSAVDVGSGGTVDLAWGSATDPDTVECNSDPSTPITYDVYYSTTSGGQDFISPDATTTALTISITGLTNDVPYYFVVRSRDSAGNQEFNIVERSATPTKPIDNTPPIFDGLILVVTDNDGGEITLTWNAATDPDDPTSSITYNIYVAESPTDFEFSQPTTTTSQQQYSFMNLERGSTYYFIVRAEDEAGNEETNTVTKSGELSLQEEEFNFLDYWWIFLVIIIILLLVVIALLARKKKVEEPEEVAEVDEVEEAVEEEPATEEE